ncbi:MAG: DUF4040 domain-containing protein [Planctomycetota bacterium]|nr:MAG: DUF4040 domain-containing protein [Planctomycetota bacterium]
MFALLVPILACLTAAALTYPLLRLLPRAGAWLLAAVPALCCAWYLSQTGAVAAGAFPELQIPWIRGLELDIGLRLDGLALLMGLVITGIGAAIVCYAGGYLHGKSNQPYIIAWLLVFMAAMLGLVTADNIVFAFVSWEATSIASFMLIGTGGHEGRLAARRAMLITGGGGLALLAGLILLAFGAAGDGAPVWTFSGLIAQAEVLQQSPLFAPGLLCVYLGAATKSAQFPFHFWLPGAMAAPTPVSAYLHSATMVKAGVFLLARMHPALGGNGLWFWVLTLAGSATVLWAAFRALQVKDLKALLAYTTLMALGTITVLLGLGSPQAALAAVAFLLAHAFYKGALFMVAGSVDHAAHSRDSEILGGLRKAMPFTAGAGLVAGLAMAGVAPLGGFAAKELVLKAGLEMIPVLICLMIGAVVFVSVAWSVVVRPFWNGGEPRPGHPHESPPSMIVGFCSLALISLLLGIFAPWVDRMLLTPAAESVRMGEVAWGYGFALWHGIGTALFLSLFAVIGGIFVGMRAIRTRAALQGIPRDRGVLVHDWLWKYLIEGGKRVTALLQNGSLYSYLMMVLITTVAFTGFALWRNWPALPQSLPSVDFFDVVLVIMLVLSSLVMATSHSRLGAIAAFGGVGAGITVFFLRYAAPDLALTQFLVDVLTVVLLVLAFRHLPDYRSGRARVRQAWSALVAICVGAMVTIGVLVAQTLQLGPKVSELHASMALPEAYGRNVVNVILVDFRAIDTFGEIIVLGIAALGVVALLRRARISKDGRREEVQL